MARQESLISLIGVLRVDCPLEKLQMAGLSARHRATHPMARDEETATFLRRNWKSCFIVSMSRLKKPDSSK